MKSTESMETSSGEPNAQVPVAREPMQPIQSNIDGLNALEDPFRPISHFHGIHRIGLATIHGFITMVAGVAAISSIFSMVSDNNI